MMRYKIAAIFGLLVAFVTPALSQKITNSMAPSAPLLGTFNGRNYTNEFFGFKLTLPDDGIIINSAETQVYKNAGQDNLKSDNERNNKLIEESIAKEIILLNYSSKVLGSTENSLFGMSVSKNPNGATANMMLAATVKTLTASGKFVVTKSLPGRKAGGKVAAGIEGKMAVGNQTINQRLYIFLTQGYGLAIVVAYTNDEGLKKMEAIIDTVKFDTK